MTDKPKQRGILEFDLEDPDAKRSLELCIQAPSLALTLWEIADLCRSQLKWNENLDDKMEKVLEEIRDKCSLYDDLVE